MKYFCISLVLGCVCLCSCSGPVHTDMNGKTWTLSEIRIRDPFILADEPSQTYYMYAQMGNRPKVKDRKKGVEVYTSKDLKTWYGPEPVFSVPEDFWAKEAVWAPEVHAYNGKYYLFVTFTGKDALPAEPNRPPNQVRGTQILVADSPGGPFEPFANKAHTPADWMALDGTLWVENEVPWMMFCHEWIQVTDGTMELVPLEPDLSDVRAQPMTLFAASDAPWVRNMKDLGIGYQDQVRDGYVTDGPFLYRTKTGRLLMIWSSFGDDKYAVGLAISKTDRIYGPWEQIPEPLFAANGGHAMIFRTFAGKLMLVLHQPNSENERAKLFELEDTGDRLRLKKRGLLGIF